MVYSWIILNLWIDEVTGLCNVWKEWSIILHKRSTSIIMGSKRWCSGESTCLPPMWPRFKTRCWRHMWVDTHTPRGFRSTQKATFLNSSLTRNRVDEEPLCGCATSKSLFIYLFILFVFQYGMYRIWLGWNHEFYHKILSFLIFAGFNTGTYLTWERTEWTQEKKLRWSSFIASGGRERIQVQSKLSLWPLSWGTSSSYDHLCETPFELWLKLCN